MAPASEVSRSDGEGFVIRDLAVAYRHGGTQTLVVGGVTLAVRSGQITGVAGESGSGKTTAVLAAIGYLPGGAVRVSGESLLDGRPLLSLPPHELRRVWARGVSYVAQDAAGALNPARKIGVQLGELLTQNLGLGRQSARLRSLELLHAVRLSDAAHALVKYPHEFSGGQLQRIAIAMGIACDPKLLVLDEPTTGLDVTTQAEVISMLGELVRERRIAALYISHDLSLLATIADELVVFYAGEVVESGHVRTIVTAPRHPYTRALLDSLLSTEKAVRARVLPGLPPGRVVPESCPFAPRCPHAEEKCVADHPPLLAVADESRQVRCVRTFELGPLASRRADAHPEAAGAGVATPLLAVDRLVCTYTRRRRHIIAVDRVSLQIGGGQVVGLVGESGSGKSTIGRAIAGILRPRAGELRWRGQPLPDRPTRRTREQRRDIQIVFQSPDSSLNPRHTVGALVERSVALFRDDVTREERARVVEQALLEVQLDPSLVTRYPHQLSGGQKQRVAIARAFVARPRLVICDEIVSGQDVSVQAAILEVVRTMQRDHRTALLFISHDLAVVRSIAQYVYVIRAGRLQEEGPTDAIFDEPASPYTRRLLDAVLEPAVRELGAGLPAA